MFKDKSRFTPKDVEKMQTSGKYGSFYDDVFKTRFFFAHTTHNGKKAIFQTVGGKEMELTKSELQIYYGIYL